jgi:hypothetical protein
MNNRLRRMWLPRITQIYTKETHMFLISENSCNSWQPLFAEGKTKYFVPKFPEGYIFYLYLQKKNKMETTKKNTLIYWIFFLLSVVLFFVVYRSSFGSYCSMVLPFNVTLFAKALDLM